ncbi:MAG TPA: YqgE/AlgH family protein [Acidimicrobiia bacterium]|jgi:putative transcriptional regulator
MLQPGPGRLLVATPHLYDPNFYRTVVLLLEHNDDGSLGVVLTRPTDEPASVHVAAWAAEISDPDVIFFGGPVRNEIAVGVAESPRTPPLGWRPVLGSIGLVDLGESRDVVGSVSRLRIFSGYAGWEAGQLEGELAEGGWFVLDASPDDVFTVYPGDLWHDVLRRQPGLVAAYATFPVDPTLN